MSGSYNRVILMGNLTRDPEVRHSGGGTAVVRIGIATNERVKGSDGEWADRPTFVDVTAFGKRGEAFAKFHRKGSQAHIEGKLRLDTWEDKTSGAKRSKLYVVLDDWQFCGGSGRGGGSEAAPTAAGASGGSDTGDWLASEDAPF